MAGCKPIKPFVNKKFNNFFDDLKMPLELPWMKLSKTCTLRSFATQNDVFSTICGPEAPGSFPFPEPKCWTIKDSEK